MYRPSENIKQKLAGLPAQPGVYLMRNRRGKIIYVGKAAVLRERVSHYFQPGTLQAADSKLRGLIKSIADFDYLALKSEAEAILTESKLIKEYKPRYNVLMRDDKRFLLLRVKLSDPFPRFTAVRLRKDDGARYWGPYASSAAAWASLEFVEKQFGLRSCSPRVPGPKDHLHCLDDIVRFCSAPCIGKVTPEEYAERVRMACDFLDGDRREYLFELRRQMEDAARQMLFEKAAALRDVYQLLDRGIREKARGRKSLQLKREEAHEGLSALQESLGLERRPDVIECYDISNISGTLSVASRVVAEEGVPAPSQYRMYRIKTVEGADDPASMAEVIRRRFSRALAEKEPLPDLILVDGGIAQLRAAHYELVELGLGHLRVAGIAEKHEELYYDLANRKAPLRFAGDSPALHVLKQIRDEAHRFALTYHSKLRNKMIQESVLDDIPGIGARRKARILQHMGSVTQLRKASREEIAGIPDIGQKLADLIYRSLRKETAPVT